jgi:hypothetical protein
LKESGHLYACNQVRFRLMKTKTYGKYVWWSERAIKASWEEGASGVAYDQLPDAVLYLDGVARLCILRSSTVFVESGSIACSWMPARG